MRISDWSSDVCSSDLVVQRNNLHLQRTVGIVLALRNILEYGVEQGAHIAFAHVFCKTRIPSQARGVNDGEIQLLFCCTQLVEQVEGGVDGKIRTSTRAVDFVDDHDRPQTKCPGLARDELRLRQGALRSEEHTYEL